MPRIRSEGHPRWTTGRGHPRLDPSAKSWLWKDRSAVGLPAGLGSRVRLDRQLAPVAGRGGHGLLFPSLSSHPPPLVGAHTPDHNLRTGQVLLDDAPALTLELPAPRLGRRAAT